ncbi:MAG: Smr/MutS family protein [Oscillospiraceae bacterium]|nr:Smr/MutS family protein [Oscillospiraceae bacterium]
MQAGILELDLHGMNAYQAKIAIDSTLKKAKGGTYRIRLIHGYRGGTVLRDLVRENYRSHPKILRIELGMNPGETDLVLREF